MPWLMLNPESQSVGLISRRSIGASIVGVPFYSRGAHHAPQGSQAKDRARADVPFQSACRSGMMSAKFTRRAPVVRSSDGTEIGFESLGDGPDILYVHGGVSDRAAWRAVAERLGGYAHHLLDRRG